MLGRTYVQALTGASEQLLCRPTGLADGLARKEPAPPPQSQRISPKVGSPVPRSQAGVRRLFSYSRGSVDQSHDACTRPQVQFRTKDPTPPWAARGIPG